MALFLASMFEALLRLVSFRRLMAFVGMEPHAVPEGQVVGPDAADSDAWADTVAWAVEAAARRTPWETKCFARALTGSVLLALRERPREIVFGVRAAKDSPTGAMTAHAWLRSGGAFVTGEAGHLHFTPVAVYRPRRPPKARSTASR